MKTINPNSKQARTVRFHEAMARMGFTYAEAETLRLAEKTLHRWAERECNGEIEREEKTGKVYAFSNSSGKRYEFGPRPRDLETGALKRIAATVEARNLRELGPATKADKPELLLAYHQTDPRGCALYLVKKSDIPEGADIGSYYTRGFAVCI